MIKDADYIVEVGPNGGDAGGELLYQGTVEGLKNYKQSITAGFI
ncbi:MAG: hypothetical protein AAF546_08405 [Verrucomicrobiota bacterium]